jgi:hypothetical protein
LKSASKIGSSTNLRAALDDAISHGRDPEAAAFPDAFGIIRSRTGIGSEAPSPQIGS